MRLSPIWGALAVVIKNGIRVSNCLNYSRHTYQHEAIELSVWYVHVAGFESGVAKIGDNIISCYDTIKKLCVVQAHRLEARWSSSLSLFLSL